MIHIENSPIEEWIGELKPYQQEIIISFVAQFGEQDAAKKWLQSNGPSNTIQFGGNPNSDSTTFYQQCVNEFNKFICGHPDYKEYRNKIKQEEPIGKGIIITLISGALASNLGFAASLLAPFVALMLFSAGKIGLNAYCSIQKFE